MTLLAQVGSRLSALAGQPAALAMGTGLLAGAVTGTAGVATADPFHRIAPGVALASCPGGGGGVVTHVQAGATVLVTARTSDGAWLEIYIGEPGITGAWAPSSEVTLSESPDQHPIDGCGAPASASAPPPTTTPAASPSMEPTILVDACALLDLQTAEAIAGTLLYPALPGGPPAATCTYAGPVSGPEALVAIYSGDGAKGTYDTDRALNHQFRAVSGIADEAWLEDDNIFFRKGTTWFAIELVRLNDPRANDQRLIDGATVVAARLP